MREVPDLSKLDVSEIKGNLPSRDRTRVMVALRGGGYFNLAQLCAATENDLLMLSGMGRARIGCVALALHGIGLRLRCWPPK